MKKIEKFEVPSFQNWRQNDKNNFIKLNWKQIEFL